MKSFKQLLDMDPVVQEAEKLMAEGTGKTYLKREVIKALIDSGKWEVDYGDADGKSGSSLTLRSTSGKKKTRRNVIIEAESADAAFKRNLKDVKAMLKRVAKEVDKMAKDQKKEPKNYGFAGSMGYVREELENIVAHFTGQE